MRCVALREYGGPEQLYVDTAERPVPGAGEVLIRVEAAGVSRPDSLQRRGHYPPPPGASNIIGLEVAGRIESVGSNQSRWSKGDHVCALVPGGGYAEYCIAAADNVLPVPAGWTSEEAATLPENMCTVFDNLFVRARLREGETVLVHGGSGGIGSTAIQLAKLFGAKVAATAGSAAKAEFCASIGADLAISYRSVDFVQSVVDWTNGVGVNVIVDVVGSGYMARNMAALSLDGRLAVLANLGEPEAQVPLTTLFKKRLTIIGSSLRGRSVEQKGAIINALEKQVWPALAERRVRPLIDSVYTLDQCAEAHRRLDASEHRGKIILRIG